jgi:hypothetical protein
VLPTQVIDVETRCLHKTDGAQLDDYAALSYCWGGDQHFKTTRANLKSTLGGAPLNNLPQTLLDAVHVCRQLKIRYLWIDALCIVQDDEEDRASEISHMRLMYSRATLVIAPSRAKEVNEGFLSEVQVQTDATIILPAQFSDTCRGQVGFFHVPKGSSGHEPLNQRGWA